MSVLLAVWRVNHHRSCNDGAARGFDVQLWIEDSLGLVMSGPARDCCMEDLLGAGSDRYK